MIFLPVRAGEGEVYLSDLNWQTATIGWGAIHRDLSVSGHTLTLNGVKYEKGIGTHAQSTITWFLNRSCSRLQASVGIDDEVPESNSAASVIFRVYGDGNLLYSSPVMKAGSSTQVIDLDITGISYLQLKADNADGSIDSDHADWVDARVTVTGKLPASTLRMKSPFVIHSSSPEAEEMFNWAKTRAINYVQTSEMTNNIPCYWAGLLDRPAFYLRDFAHQAPGAHLIGLDKENLTMTRQFALSATPERKYYPLWAFAFDGSIYPMDYHNDSDFVREVPQAFEVTACALELYKWTGDSTYLEEKDLLAFYDRSVENFVWEHDRNNNGIADDNWSQTGNIFLGTCTYNEQSSDNFIEAADGLAAQYGAYLAFAGILAAGGDSTNSDYWKDRATSLKNKFGKDWYKENQYVRGFRPDGSYGAGFDQMHISYPPRYGLTDMGDRNEAALDMLFSHYPSVAFVEPRSYHAEIYFRYNQPERGWTMMKNIYYDPRKNYPEISFVLLSDFVMGMMGVDADAGRQKVATLPRLPQDIAWLEADSVPVGDQYVSIRHEKNVKTVLTNCSDKELHWQARFYGNYNQLLLDSNPVEALHDTLDGQLISYINTGIQPGGTGTVVVDSASVSKRDMTGTGRFQIYPNPAREHISFFLDIPVRQIRLYDNAGRLWKTLNHPSPGLTRIDISSLAPGEYFLKVTGKDFVEDRKFIKTGS